jgi:signal transduction histidine kinase
MEIAIGVVAGLALGVLGLVVGRSQGASAARAAAEETGREAGFAQAKAEADARFRATAAAVSRGRIPADAAPGSAEAELGRALQAGWAPRDTERQRALREALGRLGGFLDRSVRAPLSGVTDRTGADELRERMSRALGSLEDLEFFLAAPPADGRSRDLQPLVQQVTHEFAQDQGVAVRARLDDRPVRAVVNDRAFLDAVYLLLHNAGRFGRSSTVDITVVNEDARAVIRIRDRGPGFTEEAFQRAFDPFYSTSDEGLGLGLPHARKTIEAMGGRIELRNVPDGGAEVEVSFPAA